MVCGESRMTTGEDYCTANQRSTIMAEMYDAIKTSKPNYISLSDFLFKSSEYEWMKFIEQNPYVITRMKHTTEYLASVCDWCSTIDHRGYSKVDVIKGHAIASRRIYYDDGDRVTSLNKQIEISDTMPIGMSAETIRSWIKTLYKYNATQFDGKLLEYIFKQDV